MSGEKQETQPQKKEDLQETRHPSDIDSHPIWEKEPDDVEEDLGDAESPNKAPRH